MAFHCKNLFLFCALWGAWLGHAQDTFLSHEDRLILGRSLFRQPWVAAPASTSARDGIGPLYSARSCWGCHPSHGAGNLQDREGRWQHTWIVKLSDPKSTKHHRHYGHQLDPRAVQGLRSEGRAYPDVREQVFTFPDGSQVTLKRFQWNFVDLSLGEFGKGAGFSVRRPPKLFGLGAISNLDPKAVLAHQDPFDRDRDGISGRAHMVQDSSGKDQLGLFGWKAGSSSLEVQIAKALSFDMGLSNPLFPNEDCTSVQKECLEAPRGAQELDVPRERWQALTSFVGSIPPPTTPAKNLDAEKIFERVGCADCHRPSWPLANGETISPYSDFLLHDMGSDLADDFAEGHANGREWRTPPLWGAVMEIHRQGNLRRYLHDGRANTLEEAILWHGGEALKARNHYAGLSRSDRKKLIHFLRLL